MWWLSGVGLFFLAAFVGLYQIRDAPWLEGFWKRGLQDDPLGRKIFCIGFIIAAALLTVGAAVWSVTHPDVAIGR